MFEAVVPDSSVPVTVHQDSPRDAWTGARDIVALAIGVAIYGLAFGMLAVQAGFGATGVGVMGGAVFAGGSQIVAAQRLVAGAGVGTAVVAGLALNLRLLLVTASIRDVFAGRPWWQIALGAHLATDENWALMIAERARGRDVGYWYLVGGGLCLMAVWCLSTVAGAAFAQAIPDPVALGVDFAFTAAFIAIARSLWKGAADLLPWLITAAVVTTAVWVVRLDSSWALVLGGVAGAVSASAMRHD